MPRPYLRKLEPAEDGTKARIIQASCELLMGDSGFAGFTVDAVARQADVSRATVYYQFGSKNGLLEAVLDDIAARSITLPFVLVTSRAGNPTAIEELVRAIAAFWAAERGTMRRFYGLAALDPDVGRSVAARDAERRAGIHKIISAHLRNKGQRSEAKAQAGTRIAYMLLRFETFDVLAGDAELETVVPIIIKLILAALS